MYVCIISIIHISRKTFSAEHRYPKTSRVPSTDRETRRRYASKTMERRQGSGRGNAKDGSGIGPVYLAGLSADMLIIENPLRIEQFVH